MNDLFIPLKDVGHENIAPYGALIDTEVRRPDASSAIFDYWDRLGEVDAAGRVSFGVVRSHPGPLVVVNLERHAKTSETLIPMDGEIVLVVAAVTTSDSADLGSLSAFRVPQGYAVTLRPGTWHYVPLNERQEVKTMVVFRSGTSHDDLLVDDFLHERDTRVTVKA